MNPQLAVKCAAERKRSGVWRCSWCSSDNQQDHVQMFGKLHIELGTQALQRSCDTLICSDKWTVWFNTRLMLAWYHNTRTEPDPGQSSKHHSIKGPSNWATFVILQLNPYLKLSLHGKIIIIIIQIKCLHYGHLCRCLVGWKPSRCCSLAVAS